MVNGITNFLTSPALSSISQSTSASVSIETSLKAIGRPSFILADKKIEPETKRYAATKEFLYQAICLATYMAIVIPVFKNGGFKLAKNHLFKNEKAFEQFNSAGQYLDYKKLASMSKADRTATLAKDKYKNKFSDVLQKELKNNDKPEQFNIVKGAIELGNIVGSVLGLAIFAPQVSHWVIHPALKLLGLEEKARKEGGELDLEIENGKLEVEIEKDDD